MKKKIFNSRLSAPAFLLIIGLSSCSHSNSITSGSGTFPPNSVPAISKAALIDSLKLKGNFQGVQTSRIDGRYEVVTTQQDEKYFIKNDRLVSNSRKPNPQEKSLIYWRGKFRGKAYRETPLANEAILGHERPLLEIACDKLGMGVIYDPTREEVKRVFYYGSK